jgi:hypothetical protein
MGIYVDSQHTWIGGAWPLPRDQLAIVESHLSSAQKEKGGLVLLVQFYHLRDEETQSARNANEVV